jgi:phage virion morphogenesis protein
MAYEIEAKDQGVQSTLQLLMQHLDDLTPAMEDIAGILANVTEDAFETETSPFGDPWAPLAPSTLRQALKNGRSKPKILQDSGQMAASIATSAGQDYAELSVGKIQAAIQQFGGETGRDYASVIPARSYVPIDEDGNLPDPVADEILEVLGDYLLG